jgi:hypothetical protein
MTASHRIIQHSATHHTQYKVLVGRIYDDRHTDRQTEDGWTNGIPEFELEIEILRLLVLQLHQTHYGSAEDFFVAVC